MDMIESNVHKDLCDASAADWAELDAGDSSDSLGLLCTPRALCWQLPQRRYRSASVGSEHRLSRLGLSAVWSRDRLVRQPAGAVLFPSARALPSLPGCDLLALSDGGNRVRRPVRSGLSSLRPEPAARGGSGSPGGAHGDHGNRLRSPDHPGCAESAGHRSRPAPESGTGRDRTGRLRARRARRWRGVHRDHRRQLAGARAARHGWRAMRSWGRCSGRSSDGSSRC